MGIDQTCQVNFFGGGGGGGGVVNGWTFKEATNVFWTKYVFESLES